MQNPGKSNELEKQRSKLVNSYNSLLDEFSSKELHTVGNYQLGRLIGKGSFGKVYLASNKLINGSKVVLKSAKKDDTNLAHEVHVHRQLLHPHIARLYEVIVTETLVWLVLEYCPGDELYNYLIQHGALAPSMVQKIFTQIIGAVSYVHQKSFVHRDLKLENILLDKNENVKLCDFGFTREYQGKANYLQTWCGTVCYAAPEMLKGEKYAAEKVDVWSLGIILYALLCGELPFDEDDESATKKKILGEEPKYPDHVPTAAKELITLLLSKRPLLRPSLGDILAHPWLAEHSPQQQDILKLQRIPPFTTPLEKDTLSRMRSAGVDIDTVIANVFAQRCDGLAGWWALLIEKEERKVNRRARKRKEKDAEVKSFRRISAASARLERIAPTIRESDEDIGSTARLKSLPNERVKQVEKANQPIKTTPTKPSPESNNTNERTNTLTMKEVLSPPPPPPPHRQGSPTPPPPVRKDTRIRAASNPRRRSQLAARDARKRNSGLQILATNSDLLAAEGLPKRRKRRYQAPLIEQLSSLKHWLLASSKRSKSPNANPESGLLHPDAARGRSDKELRRTSSEVPQRSPGLPTRPEMQKRATDPSRPQVATTVDTGPSTKRMSSSPSPLTPSSSYRRSGGAGLRGRKSTSSSVSSIRSMHAQHHHSHSMASSTSSNSAAPSPSMSQKSTSFSARRVSQQSLVKVLPATPSGTGFPSNVRIVRAPPPSLSESGAAFSGKGPPSPGLVFAKRKRTPFKGPMLGPGSGPTKRRDSSNSRSGSVHGRRSGEIIQEEDEEEDDVEEVDVFTPDEAVDPEERVLGSPIELEQRHSLPKASLDLQSQPKQSLDLPSRSSREERPRDEYTL
ncbi:MAG: hypothetical protein M1828_005488 [Chrysothrix sp. TS-e1954]|nr:MAG: hypothetical protein M1828_005488 [Chrysothrix sp. TS-e1954]